MDEADDVSLSEEVAELDPEEVLHIEKVHVSFRQYATFARSARSGQSRRILALSKAQIYYLPPAMLPWTSEGQERESLMKDAELNNQFFFDLMLRHAGVPNSQDVMSGTICGAEKLTGLKGTGWASDDFFSKTTSVLKSLARDWSIEGSAEREQAYTPIVESVEKYILREKKPRRVCVPGAGVGRLALEICSRGYEVQGNEFSMHMLLASDYILNGGLSPVRQLSISPWLTETRNVSQALNPARTAMIPDVDPAEMLSETNTLDGVPEFSMAAGDFESIYSHAREHGQWDCVVACFFIDTAPCVVSYLVVIFHMLRDDGLFINFGPLHYHWSSPPFRPDDTSQENYLAKHSGMDERYLQAVDMSWQDVRTTMIKIGFCFVEESLREAKYTDDPQSFMTTNYRCIFFVAKKMQAGQSA